MEQNFEVLGVNKYGFHIRSLKTGGIITIVSIDEYYDTSIKLALCTNKKMMEDTLRDFATICMEGSNVKYETDKGAYPIKIRGFKLKSMPPLKTTDQLDEGKVYMSPNAHCFSVIDLCADSLGLLHNESRKNIAVMGVEDGVPQIATTLSPYDQEKRIKDFFLLCSSDVNQIDAELYHGYTRISRQMKIKEIKHKIMEVLPEATIEYVNKKVGETKGAIYCNGGRLSINVFICRLKGIKKKAIWEIDNRKDPFPIIGLVLSIQALEKYPYIGKLYYRYTHEGRKTGVYITQQNKEKVLGTLIEQKRINLNC